MNEINAMLAPLAATVTSVGNNQTEFVFMVGTKVVRVQVSYMPGVDRYTVRRLEAGMWMRRTSFATAFQAALVIRMELSVTRMSMSGRWWDTITSHVNGDHARYLVVHCGEEQTIVHCPELNRMAIECWNDDMDFAIFTDYLWENM